jgi:outer membrane receptor protein involved in Fe transport
MLAGHLRPIGRSARVSILSLAIALGSNAAMAQDAVPPAGPDQAHPTAGDAGTTELVITGSRIARNGYDAPTPTTVIDSSVLNAKAPAQIIDALVTLPAFKNSSTASTAGNGNAGSAGQSFANLRGLGPNRTLVLLDGQRFVPSTSIATVDLSLLPSALIQRVDVVTGGASAAYGSDAVAGVVNFVLDNRYKGIKGSIEAGITTYGDDHSYKGSLTAGTDFAERGHIVVSVEGLKTNGALPGSRSHSNYPLATVITNPGWTETNGQTRRFILPNVYFNNVAYGGVITTGPLAGTEFGPGGTTFSKPAGGLYAATSSILYPSRVHEPWLQTQTYYALPEERMVGYGRVSWDLTPGLTAYATGTLARNKPGPYETTPANTLIGGAYNIGIANPFIPQAVRNQMTTLGLQSISVGRYSEDFGNGVVSRTNDTQRATIGLQGDIGGGWKLDAYAEYGRNRDKFIIANNVLKANVLLAVDAVQTPTGVMCRSTLTNPGNGCVPLNVFGPGAASPAAIDYIYGDSRAVLKLTQKVASVALSGEPFSTWAGPVSTAFGAEYRNEAAHQRTDAASQAGLFAIGNPKRLDGHFDVKEVFAETVVPLAKDMPFLHSVDLNGAVRYTDYSTSGSVVTWKIGGNWEPIDGVRFRGTRSRDIRAPNNLELFTPPVQATAFLVDPVTNTQPVAQGFSLGNPNLKPEKADTTSIGGVIQPHFLRGFEFSVDYYRINIRDAISTLVMQDIVNRCAAGNASLCSLITRVNGAITVVNSPYLNLQSLKTGGLDIEASYRTRIGEGMVTARALANRTMSFKINDGVTSIDRAGDMNVSAQPKWTGDFLLSYRQGGFEANADLTYIGSGKYDVTYVLPTDINDNHIPARANLNLQVAYDLGVPGKPRQFFLNVANVLNTPPPAIFVITGGPNYDRIGRAFRVGFRFGL